MKSVGRSDASVDVDGEADEDGARDLTTSLMEMDPTYLSSQACMLTATPDSNLDFLFTHTFSFDSG